MSPYTLPQLPKQVRRRIPKEMILAGVFFMIAMSLGGVAYSLWSASGRGNGTAAAGTTLPVTLRYATPAATLYPGSATTVVLRATNPNDFVTHIGSISLDTSRGSSAIVADSAHSACATSALSYSVQTNGTAGWNVPAQANAVPGSLAISLPNALAMSAGAASACQGASFTVYLVAGS
ncbi:hypothetical protein [Cryobacterium sp. N21]|uniref:hypothetical protein n=1 Tax=Cryobacterium sp. N21 TaxID=2048289 RepID=UPI001125016C|nr:hypothetical protein [Cryobacterium sp. N21]